MKRFRMSSLLFAALALCAFAYSTLIAPVAELVVATGRAIKNLVLDGFKLAAGDAEDFQAPKVWLIRAKVFVHRLVKRERPQVSGSWRMCPST